MAQLSKTNFKTLYGSSGSVFPDNSTGDISEADIRGFGETIADSVQFIDTSIQFTQLDLSSAQILALNSNPQQILAAQGAGTIIQPISITFWLEYGTTPYATNVNLNYQYGTLGAPSLSAAFSGAVQIDSTASYIQSRTIDLGTNSANLENKILGINVGGGNPTAGDSTLSIYLSYRVITL